MVTFVVDQKECEPDILTDVAHEDLLLVDERGQTVEIIKAPDGGWTFNSLQENKVVEYWSNRCAPLDATLGNTWVGSTEV